MTQQDKNQAFIKQFKKDNNIKTQTLLPTPLDVFAAQVVKDNCTATDGAWWRKYCEHFKLNYRQEHIAMAHFMDMCNTCQCMPWELIKFGREHFGFTKFDAVEIMLLMENLLDTEEERNDNPSSEEAYAIDDDDEQEHAVSSSSGKRRLKRAYNGEEEDDDVETH